MLIDEMFVPLKEDAEADLAQNRAAHAIMGKLIRFLYRGSMDNHYGFKAYRFTDGSIFLTLRGSDIGLSGEQARLWFCFGEIRGFVPSGSLSKFKNSGDPCINIYCLDDMQDVEAAAKTIIHRYTVHDVIIHELIHFFDKDRNPMMHKKDDASYAKYKEHGADYYNDPIETNAYFHNVAAPLLTFLRATDDVEDERVARVAKQMGISRDFKTTLDTLTTQTRSAQSSVFKTFWASLYPDRRRAFIRRLYALHQRAVQKLDQAEKVSQAMQDAAQTPI